jgi:hypothetical protein
MRNLAFLALLAACAPEGLPYTELGPPGDAPPPGDDPTGGGPTGGDPTGAPPEDDEHPNDPDDGVSVHWVDGPDAGEELTLTGTQLSVRLTNAGAAPRTVTTVVTGDGGSLQTLFRASQTIHTVSPTAPVTWTFDMRALARPGQTHAGQVTVEATSCPLGAATGCQTITAEPLYFHRDAANLLHVYDAEALCALRGCGDLAGTAPVEPGLSRVLGGGPMTGLRDSDRRAPEGPEVNRRFRSGDDDLGNPTCAPTDPTCNPTGAP